MKNEDIFAKKIIDILGKEPKISPDIEKKLFLARMSAVKKKKEKFSIRKYLDFSFSPYFKGLIPLMSFTLISISIGFVFNENDSDKEINEISAYSAQADVFDMDLDLELN